MPRGQPDYGLTTQTHVASGISDPGEAAARLGSINVYDRRGWTVWMDDFEAPNSSWMAAFVLPGVSPVLATTASWMGVQSMYFSSAIGFGQSELAKWCPLLRLGRMGVEFWVRGYTRTPGYFRCLIDIYDGVNQTRAEVRVDFEASTVSIVTPLGTFVIDTGAFPAAVAMMPFVPIKVVVDMDTDMYTRLLVGSSEYDISMNALVNIGVTTDRIIRAYFNLQGGPAAATYTWLDNFILTQNEP